MTAIKSVLSLLCQHLDSSVNVTMRPEYFRLAKFNGTAENVKYTFWKLLNTLSYSAVREKEMGIDLQHCDIVWATKLYFAFLKYPAIEFYALSKDSNNNRLLLIAFAWLLGTQDILNIVMRRNVSNSVLGRECSYPENTEKVNVEEDVPESLIAQINNVLHLNHKVNYNIKEIYELVSEKAKLVSRVHDASVNVSGLPHLSVSELALIKRILTINKDEPSVEDKKYLEELSAIGSLLHTHMKWLRQEHVFFDWMVTVVEEQSKTLHTSLEDIDWNEISMFIALIRSLMQEKLETLSSEGQSNDSYTLKFGSGSRLLRAQSNKTELDALLAEISAEVNKEKEDLSKRKEKLSEELKEILQMIPSCIQV